MKERSIAERIRDQAGKSIASARTRGEKTVQIVAGEIHENLHLQNLLPNVCQALKGKKFLEKYHLAIEAVEGPPSGMGATLKITYRLMGEEGQSGPAEDLPLMRLLGAGKEVFKSLGGAEAFIRREREQFYGDREEP